MDTKAKKITKTKTKSNQKNELVVAVPRSVVKKKEKPLVKVENKPVVKTTKKSLVKKEKMPITKKLELKVVKTVDDGNKDKIKVLYVVSECQPFCATGGLADVAGSLPKFIQNNNPDFDVRVVLPMYSNIAEKFKKDFEYIGNTNIPLSWRSVYCGVFKYVLNNVTFYFLDNEYYFKRDGGIYSYYDDGERFAFTSRAVLEILPLINFMPNIIHCNDWQTALVPIYLKTVYANNPNYQNIKTVFTLHNTEYQGKFDINLISDLFGLDQRFLNVVEFNNNINLVKGAVCCCDKFTTVSPSYAKEILQPEHSNGLEEIFKQNIYKTQGILNAIDYEFYCPKTDKELVKNYDEKSLAKRVENKLACQKEFGLKIDENAPMLSMVTRMAKHKGLDLIRECLEGILHNSDVQLIVVGGGDKEYEDYFNYLQNKYSDRVKALLGYSNPYSRKAYSSSDIFLMPSKSEPCGISQMVASRYGAVPIVRETGGLKDSIKDFGCEGGGNGYTFSGYNVNDLVYSINRAINDFRDKKSWQQKIKACITKDFSWSQSAKKYVEIYKQLLK